MGLYYIKLHYYYYIKHLLIASLIWKCNAEYDSYNDSIKIFFKWPYSINIMLNSFKILNSHLKILKQKIMLPNQKQFRKSLTSLWCDFMNQIDSNSLKLQQFHVLVLIDRNWNYWAKDWLIVKQLHQIDPGLQLGLKNTCF